MRFEVDQVMVSVGVHNYFKVEVTQVGGSAPNPSCQFEPCIYISDFYAICVD